MINPTHLMPDNWLVGPDGKPVQVKFLNECEEQDRRGRPVIYWAINMMRADQFKELKLTIDLFEERGFPTVETEEKITIWLPVLDELKAIALTYFKKGTDSYAQGEFVLIDFYRSVASLDDLQRAYLFFTRQQLEISL
jgi:hypothetical protein